MKFTFEIDQRGYIRKRESYNLEFKENFQRGDQLLKYIKTLVGMANNRGGQIVFGIKDSPRLPMGMTNTKFMEIDPKDIDSRIREYFEPSIRWEMDVIEYNEKSFGLLYTEEALEKPIVCKKNKDNILREGAIYYRYRGETKEIEYAELKRILDSERENERLLWIKHIKKISNVGPRNIQLLDLFNGEVTYGDSKILIDRDLVEKLHVIKEGQFVEKDEEGVPVLKLVGSIEGFVETENVIINPNKMFPYTTQQMQDKLGVNRYEMLATISALGLKKREKHHAFINQGINSGVHKYSASSVELIQRLFERKGKNNCITEWVANYKEKLKK